MSALVSLLSIGANLAQARIPPPPSLVSTKSPTSQVLVNSKSHKNVPNTIRTVAPSLGKIPPSGGAESARDEERLARHLEWRPESEERQQKTCVESARDENERDRFCSSSASLLEFRAATVANRLPRDFVRLKRKGKTKEAAKGNSGPGKGDEERESRRRRGRQRATECPSVR
ncbi:unnamed protein product [Dovyalis caffra]|uniref:Uncharacterized protein n=1 Tax=Dovyalis caffra TaxID=77055 RepID=A0AAV1R7R9_9ROSI|nr:unnamed protein product [Dovyalis caffra]